MRTPVGSSMYELLAILLNFFFFSFNLFFSLLGSIPEQRIYQPWMSAERPRTQTPTHKESEMQFARCLKGHLNFLRPSQADTLKCAICNHVCNWRHGILHFHKDMFKISKHICTSNTSAHHHNSLHFSTLSGGTPLGQTVKDQLFWFCSHVTIATV